MKHKLEVPAILQAVTECWSAIMIASSFLILPGYIFAYADDDCWKTKRFRASVPEVLSVVAS